MSDDRKIDHFVAQAIVQRVESDCHGGLGWGSAEKPDHIKVKLSEMADKHGYVPVMPFFQWLADQRTNKCPSHANANLSKIKHFMARAAVK